MPRQTHKFLDKQAQASMKSAHQDFWGKFLYPICGSSPSGSIWMTALV